MRFVYDNFDVLFDTPESIESFKKLVLEMAVRGKLVPQDPDDELASVLLQKIKQEKEKLIKEGKIKKEKPLPAIREDEIPFELPESWEWVRLGEIALIIGGGTPKTNNSNYYTLNGIPWLTPADLYKLDNKFISKGKRDISELGLKNSSARLLPRGTVVFSSRAPIGYVAIAENELCTNQGFKSCVPHEMSMNEFIYYFLRCVAKSIEDAAPGTTFKEVSGKIVSNILFPLPPHNEQKRIVQKIDEIFNLLTPLSEAMKQRTEYNRLLNKTSIHRLNTSTNIEALTQNMHFILNNFDTLYGNIENVKELRQAILTLAVQGKLVPQDPNDEPASVLLEKIKAEKERLIKEGRIKKEKPLAPIKEEEVPFELPENWEWTRLGSITKSGATGIVRSLDEQNEWFSYPYFKMNNISINGSYNYDNISNINASSAEVERFKLKEGDFLFNTRNSRELVGKTCVIENIPYKTLLYNNNILKIEYLNKYVMTKYINYWFHSSPGKLLLELFKSNTTNVCAIYQKQLYTYILPVSPFNEQQRIVQKIEMLIALCDDLEKKIEHCRVNSKQLLQSVLYANG